MAETMQSLLEARVRAAVESIAPGAALSGAIVTSARDPQHGDYSTPVAMQLEAERQGGECRMKAGECVVSLPLA